MLVKADGTENQRIRRPYDQILTDRTRGSDCNRSCRANFGQAQSSSRKVRYQGDGGTDYVAVESRYWTRVRIARHAHDGGRRATGKVVGDIPDTPGVHGAGIATKAGHGFTTNGRDFHGHDVRPEDACCNPTNQGRGRLDGIMYDEPMTRSF